MASEGPFPYRFPWKTPSPHQGPMEGATKLPRWTLLWFWIPLGGPPSQPWGQEDTNGCPLDSGLALTSCVTS